MNWQSIFNPFSRYSEKQLFLVGFVFLIVNSIICFFTKTQMESILHFTPNSKLSLQTAFLFVIISCSTATLFLFLIVLVVNKRTRFIDIVTTVLISQVPNFFILLTTKFSGMNEVAKKFTTVATNKMTTFETTDVLLLFVFSLIVLAFVVYSMVLLYNGFKTATNFKKWYHISLFVISLLFFTLLHQLYVSTLLNN
jgi:hypothetical protein